MAGRFASLSDDFTDFLKRLSAAEKPVPAFVARNFLLDEGISDPRAKSYQRARAGARHADYQTWLKAHGDYLINNVFRPRLAPSLASTLDPNDPLSCPETFRPDEDLYFEYDLQLDLIRVEELRGFAQVAGLPEKEVRQAAADWLNEPTAESKKTWEDVLGLWADRAEVRPMFAALFEDVAPLLEDRQNWAERLRDALGLAHLDPAARGRPIEILVFRYPVKVVPRLRTLSSRRRPLAVPTVLDSRFSPAFCPAPRGCATGYVIDLSGSASELRREVIHPPVPFRADHLVKLGEVRRSVDLTALLIARGLHLLAVRGLAARPQYASETEGDLL